jgi:MFS family permease
MTDNINYKTSKNKNDLDMTPSMRASIGDGVSNSVMMGFGETYLGPFGIFLHASTLMVGVLATLPQFLGAIMQWVGALNMDRVKSRRKVIVRGVGLQAITLIPIAFLPLIFGKTDLAVIFLLVLIIIYQGSNGTVLPIWNSLIGDLIPASVRGRFFGYRNRLTGFSTFISLVIAGGILHLFEEAGFTEFGFLIIFFLAFFARLNSMRWLSKYADPKFRISSDQVFTFRQFIKRSPYSNFAKFVFFVGAINFGVSFSGPYFSLYMLRDLNFSYIQYTIVVASSIMSQFLAFRYWGELSDRFGNKKLINVCGWALATVPLLWLVSENILWLILIQLYGGLVWSGFSLSSTNFLFDAVTPPKRGRCVAYQSLVNSVFVILGSVAGGYTASRLPSTFNIGPFFWKPSSLLLVIFLISGIIRLVASAVFLRKFIEVRPVEPIEHKELIYRVSHIKPLAGATFSLLTGIFVGRSQKEDEHDADEESDD